MKRRPLLCLIVLAALALSVGCTSYAAPAQIIFIRHAEKPADGPELSERGWERAHALARLFTSDPRVLEHGPIAAIFAMKPLKAGDSVRALQTMEATTRALGLKIDRHYSRDEIDELIGAILKSKTGNGKTVVVCWEHNMIPKMLKALGWKSGPKKWDDGVYDRLWILDLEDGKPVRVRDLPQKLLPGDKPS
jgi:hypothetical protein